MAIRSITELVETLLTSPRGIIAVIAAVGSFVALIYLFVLKDDGKTSSKKRAKKTSPTKQTPNKQTPNSLKKSSPSAKKQPASGKKDTSKQATPVANKKTDAAGGKSAGKTPTKQANDKKANSSRSSPPKTGDDKKSNAKGVTPKQGVNLQNKQQQNKKQKDEGEWITVAKKKPRSSTNKRSPGDEDLSAPQTRSSARKVANSANRGIFQNRK